MAKKNSLVTESKKASSKKEVIKPSELKEVTKSEEISELKEITEPGVTEVTKSEEITEPEITKPEEEITKSEETVSSELSEGIEPGEEVTEPSEIKEITKSEEISEITKIEEGIEPSEIEEDEKYPEGAAYIKKLNPYLEDFASKWITCIGFGDKVHKIFKGSYAKAYNAANNFNILHGFPKDSVLKVRK